MRRYTCKYNKSAQRLRQAAATEAFQDLEPYEAMRLEDAMQRLGKQLRLGPQSTFELLTCLGIYLAENKPVEHVQRGKTLQPRLPERLSSYEFFPS